MEMLLMGLVMSLLGVSVSALLFAAATDEGQPGTVPAEATAASSAFFTEAKVALVTPPVSVDVLLLQIERHVRVEQAAVEAFLAMPTAESLHTPSGSPLAVH
jgi:hypothetical protein